MLSDLLRPVLAHDRFHLIFQTEFQLLQPRLLQLFLISRQVGKRFQVIQLAGRYSECWLARPRYSSFVAIRCAFNSSSAFRSILGNSSQ